MADERVDEFTYEGQRLVYREFGSGERPVVLLPGLLLPSAIQHPLARALAQRGNRVICFDLLGHGESDAPRDMWRYSMPLFSQQVVALLDHLELDQAVVGGTSLGANVALEVAVRAPDRLRGTLIEMPVLDNALVGCTIAFGPLLVGLTLGAPAAKLVSFGARKLPRGLYFLVDAALDSASKDPYVSAAILQGLFFGRIAPPRSERTTIETRALVIGHSRDPVHPFSDADMLVRELRRGRLVQANSILELRVTPQRLTSEIAHFLDDCWRPASRRSRQSSSRAQMRAS
jgi:pimeloyl-ACP methyl ester carboxylesterase